jgi:hypothetical protein
MIQRGLRSLWVLKLARGVIQPRVSDVRAK